MSTIDHKWIIYSNEHGAYWRANQCGYTTDLAQAGRYSEAEARECCDLRSPRADKPPPEVMYREEDLVIGLKETNDAAQAKVWLDELDPLLSVPPTTKTPAVQFKEASDLIARFRDELLTARQALATVKTVLDAQRVSHASSHDHYVLMAARLLDEHINPILSS